MRNPLDTMLRIRKLTVDDAQRELAELLRAEEAAHFKVRAAEGIISQEAGVAADLANDDDVVEAFAAWLPIGRARVAVARAETERLQNEVARARAALTKAKTAAESVEDLLARRVVARERDRLRREQFTIDETAAQRATDQ